MRLSFVKTHLIDNSNENHNFNELCNGFGAFASLVITTTTNTTKVMKFYFCKVIIVLMSSKL